MIYSCPDDDSTFDGPYPEADDVNETVTWFEIFSTLVGK
jgi:hypothetical protein